MNKMIAFLFALGMLAMASFAQDRVIGYFPNWAQISQFTPQDVRFHLLTEVRYGYLLPAGSELAFADESDKPNFEQLVALAKAAGVPVVASVGGIGNEDAMKEAAGDAATFVSAAQAFASQYGVAGFEIDGGASDPAAMIKLAAALADAGLKTSVALTGDEATASVVAGTPAEASAETEGDSATSAEVAAPVDLSADLAKLDAVSVWFTDQTNGQASELKPNSDGSYNERILSAFASAGVPQSKLIPILPLYGKTFLGGNGGLGSSVSGVGQGTDGALPYRQILELFNDAAAYKVDYDAASMSEVAVGANEAIVFNGIPSLKAMAEAVKNGGYGGVALFDLSNDNPEPIVSLVVTVGQVLRPGVDYKKKK
jgi:hypothetical protein